MRISIPSKRQLAARRMRPRVDWAIGTYLLHDSGFALGKGDVTTRLVRDELDLNLSSLASWLVIIVVVVICSGRSLALDAAGLSACN